jgi:hypothetical protein
MEISQLPLNALRGWMFASSLTLVEAAARGVGLALVPSPCFVMRSTWERSRNLSGRPCTPAAMG